MFDRGYWVKQGSVTGEAAGRGKALLLDTDFGQAVLRQYLRGGWAAKASRDQYVFSGFGNSRPMMEFAILEQLCEAGLPAPRPIAAMCAREGALYRGWILMRMIPEAQPLADLVGARRDDAELWREVGACIRRFHDHGLVHADLNARNILVGPANDVHLIDFDRARIRKGDSRAFASNLKRLKRSLNKVWPEPDRQQLPWCWLRLQEGYDQPGAVS